MELVVRIGFEQEGQEWVVTPGVELRFVAEESAPLVRT